MFSCCCGGWRGCSFAGAEQTGVCWYNVRDRHPGPGLGFGGSRGSSWGMGHSMTVAVTFWLVTSYCRRTCRCSVAHLTWPWCLSWRFCVVCAPVFRVVHSLTVFCVVFWPAQSKEIDRVSKAPFEFSMRLIFPPMVHVLRLVTLN
jgi:uncharacterized membrane protein YwzB